MYGSRACCHAEDLISKHFSFVNQVYRFQVFAYMKSHGVTNSVFGSWGGDKGREYVEGCPAQSLILPNVHHTLRLLPPDSGLRGFRSPRNWSHFIV